jgi:hypothetical protein
LALSPILTKKVLDLQDILDTVDTVLRECFCPFVFFIVFLVQDALDALLVRVGGQESKKLKVKAEVANRPSLDPVAVAALSLALDSFELLHKT